MKIEELHIYGFGRLENLVMTTIEDFQVFYGENEAGKSTIMAFIHAILFGFPTKQQQELRYEPKGGGRYGGKISVRHPEHGFAIIERIKGKAAGDVTVSLEDGTTGGEDLLKRFLGNFDRSMFQAVFSFNLHGLQNIHHMKNDDLGRFLFSSGTLGTDRLARAETELQKDLDARYKPSGRKPLLNSKLASLRTLEGELKKAAEKNGGYEAFIAERESLLNKIDELKSAIPELADKAARLKEWEKIEELAREEAALEAEIAECKEIDFPVRGIERLESCKQILRPFSSQIESLVGRRKALAEELDSFQINQELLAREPEVNAAADGLHEYEQAANELKQLEDKILLLDEKIVEARTKLYLHLSEDEILAINTDIFTKRQAETAADTRKRIDGLKQQLETAFTEEKASLEQLESELKEAKLKLLTQDERSRLEKAARTGSEAEINLRLEDCRERIAILEKAAKQEADSIKTTRAIGFSAAGVALVLLLFGLLDRVWLMAGIGFLMALVSAAIALRGFKASKSDGQDMELERHRKKEQELETELSSLQSGGSAGAALKLEQDKRERMKVNSLEAMLGQQNLQYEKVLSKFERLEQEEADWRNHVTELCSVLRIGDSIGSYMPVESFQLIEECKNAILEKSRLAGKIHSLQDTLAEFEKTIRSLSEFIQGIPANDVRLACHFAKTALEEEKRKVILHREKKAALEELDYDVQKLEKEKSLHEKELKELFAQAGAGNEEEYYLLGEEARKQDRLRNRLSEVKRELALSRLKGEERAKLLPVRNVAELIEKAAEQLKETENKLEAARSRLTEVRYEIQVLEEGGTYSEILHTFRQAQSDFAEEAKEWAVRMLARELLQRTVNRFRDYHLPKLLEKAGEYLEFLTGGNYMKLFVSPSGTGFLIERADHIRFEAEELSQATTEQVYVSLRLALAETIYGKFSFPLIIDDSFVNFDGERARRMIELLKNMKNRQVLFFTCHEHLLGHFEHGQIYHLGRKPANIRG
ncbi:hypothetical protein D1B31_00120 [Neobacillus notoginsengisoli]|uniref:YhaN AAA domain-containing protein n=1 Tax=Neobacillus notoginsengisoli TaxID=1578198 RepID=A0A417YZ17_9BACI|nr:AAA family ATPase [Neobacillus notoginsengisoli]RHW43122.1 hypothetical protein D1B31_00120 [Neobacillus notoginsengisoli]